MTATRTHAEILVEYEEKFGHGAPEWAFLHLSEIEFDALVERALASGSPIETTPTPVGIDT